MTETTPTQAQPVPLSVIYNGGCPVCMMEINHYQRLAAKRGISSIDWRDLSAADAGLEQFGLDQDSAMRRLHAREGTDGPLLSGPPAFAALWRRLPGYGWMGRMVTWPGVRHVAWFVYEGLAWGLYRWNKSRVSSQRAAA